MDTKLTTMGGMDRHVQQKVVSPNVPLVLLAEKHWPRVWSLHAGMNRRSTTYWWRDFRHNFSVPQFSEL